MGWFAVAPVALAMGGPGTPNLTNRELRVMLVLLSHADADTHSDARPGQERIAKMTGLSVRKVRDAVARLRAAGLIATRLINGCLRYTIAFDRLMRSSEELLASLEPIGDDCATDIEPSAVAPQAQVSESTAVEETEKRTVLEAQIGPIVPEKRPLLEAQIGPMGEAQIGPMVPEKRTVLEAQIGPMGEAQIGPPKRRYEDIDISRNSISLFSKEPSTKRAPKTPTPYGSQEHAVVDLIERDIEGGCPAKWRQRQLPIARRLLVGRSFDAVAATIGRAKADEFWADKITGLDLIERRWADFQLRLHLVGKPKPRAVPLTAATVVPMTPDEIRAMRRAAQLAR